MPKISQKRKYTKRKKPSVLWEILIILGLLIGIFGLGFLAGYACNKPPPVIEIHRYDSPTIPQSI